MPTLIARVRPDTKTRFRHMAKVRGLSESELLRAVILAVTGEEGGLERPTKPDVEKADTTRITVRMPRFLMEGASARAKARGMARSRWITSLIQSHLTRLPVMTDDELAGLHASNRELAALGRNLNQIARRLNEAFYETERVRLDKLAELRQAIAENRGVIRRLVRASQNAWEADDGTN